MQYNLKIREHNKQAHLDIEKDIKARGNGLFTFTLRINGGNIVDYNVTEYVDAKQKYLQLKRIVIEELSLTRHSRERGTTNTFWPDNLQRGNPRWGGLTGHTQYSQKQKNKV